MGTSNPPKQVLLLTHARTASHLLAKMLSAQPNVAYLDHPFAMARPHQVKLLDEGPIDKTSQDTKAALLQAWQNGVGSWETFVSEASAKGQIPFIHCHPHFMVQPALVSAYVYGSESQGKSEPWVVTTSSDQHHSPDNPSILPDALLLRPGTVPVFTIRHPMAMVPSIWATIRSVGGTEVASDACQIFSSALHWQRLYHDWFAENGPDHGVKPLIVDADDYQGANRKEYMERFCEAMGLDPSKLIFSWSKASDQELSAMPPMVAAIKKTILGSDGVIDGRGASSLDMGAERKRWIQEYGEENARFIQDLVDRTMPDYEYLRARKFK